MSYLLHLPNITYCIEVITAMILFWLSLEKRNYPFLRLLIGIPLLAAESLWVGPWLQQQEIHLWFFVVFLTVFGICLFSAKISVWEALFCLSCAYLMQHFASSAYLFLFQMGWLPENELLLKWMYPAIYILIYSVFYILFARSITENGHYPVSTGLSVLITAITITVVYYLSIFTRQLASFMNVDTETASYQIMLGICQIYAMFVCFLTLSILKLYRNELHAWKMLETNKAIWNQRRQQYEFSRENMELMNHRLHDMKHQIAAISQMENGGSRRDAYVHELESILHAAETYAETGNEALDTILTEKGLYCKTHAIQWSCVADGSFLTFMDVVDLYTLMGNALDNAVESVEKTEDEKKRFISVNIRQEKGFALIQIKNHMEGKLHFRENLPVTSKDDAANHGFGIKSIRSIVEKYHGTMTVTADNNIFVLTILIPLSQ